jgi:transposase
MKIPKQAYTAEFKELAVKRVKDGQSVGMVCRELGLSDQTLRNWVKAAAEGKLNGAGRVVTPRKWSCRGCAPRISGSSGRTKS